LIKRTIEISQQPTHLAVKLNQLLLQRRGDTVASIPCEDIGVVLVDEPQTTYSHAALAALVGFDAVLIVCGRDHLPTGILLPLSDHTQVVWRVHDQIAVSKPLRKQLWKQLVQAKVEAQATNLSPQSPGRLRLTTLARSVRSGDTSNVEAQAARVYWSVWLGESPPFRRDPDGPPPNNLLNYGYAVFRATIARALVAAGLLPALGLHHHNRSNAFCLADDLIEPLRPLVDARVRWLFEKGNCDLTPACKASLLQLLTEDVRLDDGTGPLMVAIQRMVASLANCFGGEAERLLIPTAIG
jgi:CRISP-associated protein Cas1